jgi:hypothetical protein
MNRWIRHVRTAGAVTLLLAATASAFAEEYQITLTDLTTGQPFSPPVFATHDSSLTLWQPGAAASNGIQQIAETGNRMPLVSDLTPLVGGSVRDLVTPLSSPLLPGGTVSIRIQADSAHPWLSSAWMLGRTNDTFSGQHAINLLDIVGTQTFELAAYDAGTEVNTELAADLIALGGNGRVAENGVIHLSPGLRGIDHFDNGLGYDANGERTDAPASWRWDTNSPVARLTITAVPEPGTLALGLSVLIPSGLLVLRRRRNR